MRRTIFRSCQDFGLAPDERCLMAVDRGEEGPDQRHPAAELRPFELIGLGNGKNACAEQGLLSSMHLHMFGLGHAHG